MIIISVNKWLDKIYYWGLYLATDEDVHSLKCRLVQFVDKWFVRR